MVRARSPASAGVVFIFQLAAITIGRSCLHHARGARVIPRPTGPLPVAARPGPRRPSDPPDPAPDGRLRVRRPTPLVVVERQPLDAVQGPLDGGAVQVQADGDLGQRRLGCLAPGLATARTVRGCSPRRPSASSVSIAASWRPAAATERCRFADSALITRLRSPRIVRATLPGLELQERGAGPDAPEERGDGLGALPGHDAVAAPDAPRRREPDGRRGAPRGSGASADRDARTPGARARRRGSAIPGPGTGRAATPAAVLGGTRPRERRSRAAAKMRRPPGADPRRRGPRAVTASRAIEASREATTGAQAGDLREAVARSRADRRPPAPRGARRRGPGPPPTSGPRSGRALDARRARPPAAPALALPGRA